MENILQEADRLTSGDRRRGYGPPWEHHTKTAAIATVLLEPKLKNGEEITSRDFQRIIIADKLVRDTNEAKRDNLVDIAGYARTAEMVEDRMATGVAPDDHEPLCLPEPEVPLTSMHLDKKLDEVQRHNFILDGRPHKHPTGRGGVVVEWNGREWVDTT